MYSRRDILKSSRSKKKTQKSRRSFLFPGVVFIIILIFIGTIAWQSGNQKISVSEIKIEGNHVVKSKDIIEFSESELSGRYFWLFSKRNIFIYPKKKLENKILDKYKRILDIDIYADSLTSLVIKISERNPEYIHCGKDVFESDDEITQCYFLDNTGYIFSKAPYFSGNVFFEFYGSIRDGFENPIGTRFLEENDFRKIILLKEGIEEIGLPLVMFKIGEEGDYTFYIKDGGKIFFNKNQDYAKVLDNLDSALGNILSLNKKLDYVDLRFGNKVFYKFIE